MSEDARKFATSLFRKNLLYKSPVGNFDYAELVNRFKEMGLVNMGYFMEKIYRQGGASALAETCIKCAQIKGGIQYIVQKELSDDLIDTDFLRESEFQDLPWPGPIIEFFFEDESLPTCLVMYTNAGIVNELATLIIPAYKDSPIKIQSDINEPTLGIVCDNRDDYTSCVAVHNKETFQMALLGQQINDLGSPVNLKQSPEEAKALSFMLTLCLKVIAYSSIPQFKPVSVTRKQMGRGPKPGVHNRPQRPAFRVQYLPKVVTQTINAPGDGKKTHVFYGRRGHLRFFRHERFVNLKGKWIYMPPIKVLDEHGKMVYKVRKV